MSGSSGRPLQSGELATAAAMSAVAVGLVVLSSVVPHAGPLQVLAVVPYGIVADRHRRRALVASIVAGASVATLITGLGGGLAIGVFAATGGFIGELKRRGRGLGTVCLAAAVLAPLLAGLAVGLLSVFAASRQLALQSLKSTVTGFGSVLRHLGPLHPVGDSINHAANTVIAHWQITIGAAVLVIVPIVLAGSWVLIGEVLERLRWVETGADMSLVAAASTTEAEPAPLPVELLSASVSYGDTDALVDVDLQVPVGQFIVVIGDNGSGKSTLARLLAGARPTRGSVRRSGPVGLGQPGGTAMIAQRPDAQVVGLRVCDDVVWGLPEDHGVDVESLLNTVGLGGMAAHDTATLSGGQLQRLAVAAALARRPRLLISDESTAMIDPAGREELIAVFAQLPRRWPMSVVHITHNASEVAFADRVVRLEHGRVAQDTISRGIPRAIALRRPVPASSAEVLPSRSEPLGANREGTADPVSASHREPSLTLNDLGHVYAYGTVWERRALGGVSLAVGDGEGLMFAGDNGSGKSTLAWIIAGLLRPTDGTCLLDGVPTHRHRGGVAIAFQHARLQLQRPTVGQDIADAAGLHAMPQRPHHSGPDPAGLDARITFALLSVGLDPGLAGRSIEQLSGGQQRRVALAGLLARNPRVLVLDEPLAGLDAPARLGLAELLTELRERAGLTLIVVTHDPEPLAAVCPRMVRLDHGRIVEDTGAEVLPTDLENTAA